MNVLPEVKYYKEVNWPNGEIWASSSSHGLWHFTGRYWAMIVPCE